MVIFTPENIVNPSFPQLLTRPFKRAGLFRDHSLQFWYLYSHRIAPHSVGVLPDFTQLFHEQTICHWDAFPFSPQGFIRHKQSTTPARASFAPAAELWLFPNAPYTKPLRSARFRGWKGWERKGSAPGAAGAAALQGPRAHRFLVWFANFVWRLTKMIKLAPFLSFHYYYHLMNKKSGDLIPDHHFLNKMPIKCRNAVF